MEEKDENIEDDSKSSDNPEPIEEEPYIGKKEEKGNPIERKYFKPPVDMVILSEKGNEIYQEKSILSIEIERCVSVGICTRQLTLGRYWIQKKLYQCEECGFTENERKFICESCFKLCHSGHKGIKETVKSERDLAILGEDCCCGDNKKNEKNCKCMGRKFHPSIDIELYKKEVPEVDRSFNGKGQYFFKNGGYYIGDWKSGKMHGNGILFGSTNERYERYTGEFVENRMEGKGKWCITSGNYYEGEIVDGKAHGFGKNYFDGRLFYEGEWEDKLPHGHGTRYYDDGGKLVCQFVRKRACGIGKLYLRKTGGGEGKEDDCYLDYEGELKDDLFHGKGTRYTEDGKVFYRGDWKNGKKDGFGEQFKNNGEHYVGEWVENRKSGKGKSYYNGELIYEGDFLNSSFHGNGTRIYDDGSKYVGEFKRNRKNGFGTSYHSKGFVYYKGEHLNGVYHGEGTYFYVGKVGKKVTGKIVGTFRDGNVNGFGTSYMICDDKDILVDEENRNAAGEEEEEENLKFWKRYEGEFKNSIYHGKGVLFNRNGTIYCEGTWKEGKQDGYVVIYKAKEPGSVFYRGHMKEGRVEGVGEWRGKRGARYEGEWKNNKRNGKGRSYSNNYDRLDYEGFFVEDKFHGVGRLYVFKNRSSNVLCSVYDGNFKEKKRHGKGLSASIQSNGKENFVVVVGGEWERDVRVNEKDNTEETFAYFKFRKRNNVVIELHKYFNWLTENALFFEEVREIMVKKLKDNDYEEYTHEKELEMCILKIGKRIPVFYVRNCENESFRGGVDGRPDFDEMMCVYGRIKKLLVESQENKKDVEERTEYLFHNVDGIFVNVHLSDQRFEKIFKIFLI